MIAVRNGGGGRPLEEMGQTVSDERYKDVIFEARPAEYERRRNSSYDKRDFVMDNSQHIIHTTYVDNLSHSHPSRAKPHSQAAALACKWRGTLAATCATTAKATAGTPQNI